MSERASIIPEAVLRSKGYAACSGRARAVLTALWLFAGQDRRCWPSKAEIAFWAGAMSRSSVTRGLAELENACLVERLRKSGGRTEGGRGVTGMYRLLIPTGAALRPLPQKMGRNIEPVKGCEDEPVNGRSPAQEGAQSCIEGAQYCAKKGRTGEPGKDTVNNTKNSALVGDAEADSPAMTFPLRSGGDWRLTRAKLDELAETFPVVDVAQCCREARQWLRDNPGRRKTASGMSRFLAGWIKRDRDAGKHTPQTPRVLDNDPVEPPDEVFT